ncbi:hypothetical protein FQA39_LY05525 [Lamprigera yunnana]|nr:hypothetical protein FQA39_LY05525 [Lamprigera yunnana]
MEVRKQFAQAVCKQWQEDEVIVPTNIKRKVFVTTAVDNIDELSRYELHGTAMSLISHSIYDNIGEDPPPLPMNVSEFCTVELSDSYTIALFVNEYDGNVFISGINNESTVSDDELWMTERHWLQHLNMVVKDNDGQLQEIPVSSFMVKIQNMLDQGQLLNEYCECGRSSLAASAVTRDREDCSRVALTIPGPQAIDQHDLFAPQYDAQPPPPFINTGGFNST